MPALLAQPDERAEVLPATHCLVNRYLLIKALITNEIKTNGVKRTTAFLPMEIPLMDKKKRLTN